MKDANCIGLIIGAGHERAVAFIAKTLAHRWLALAVTDARSELAYDVGTTFDGVKFVRVMMNEYYANEPMDQLNKGLFAFASYNAGPARIRQLRAKAAARGLDPNKWFNNVEIVAAENIGRETVQYVANIYKYYLAYQMAVEQMKQRERAKAAS